MSESVPLFVVGGQSGEYSDRSEWTVGAFLSRAAADKKEAECTDFARKHRVHRDQPDACNYEEREVFLASVRDGSLVAPDPAIRVDYTGSDYCVYEMPLLLGDVGEVEALADRLMAAREALR